MRLILVSSLLIVSISVTFLGCGEKFDIQNDSLNDDGINALIIVPKNFGLNYQLQREVIDRYGWNIIHTGVFDTITACPPVLDNLPVDPIIPDLLIHEITNIEDYDCIIITHSTGNFYEIPNSNEDIIKNPEAIKLIKDAADKGIPVFASCAGVRILAAADVLSGKEITGSPRFIDEYNQAGAIYLGKDKPPTVAGNIITSMRGQLNSVGNINTISAVMEKHQNKTGKKEKSKNDFIYTDSANFDNEEIIFSKTFGGFASDGAHALLETRDGGFLVTGYTFSEGSGDADIMVVKTAVTGELEWTATFGGKGMDYGYDCAIDGNDYLIVGYTSSYGAGSKDVYLTKIDEKGRIIWEKTYGGKSWDVGKSVCVTNEREYLLCGFTHSFGKGEEDIYVIMTDSMGNEIWSKTFGGERLDMGNTILVNSEGNYIVGATSGSFAGGNSDIYLVEIDTDGNEIWAKAYQAESQVGYGFDWCESIELSNKDGYIITGYSDCNQLMDAYIQYIDNSGKDIWQKPLGPGFYHYARSTVETDDGFLITCGSNRHLDGNGRIYLSVIDSVGQLINQMTLDGSGLEYGRDICRTKDGNIAIVGYTDSFGKGKFDACLIKLNMSM
jgi:putative intracellular protease/amidase